MKRFVAILGLAATVTWGSAALAHEGEKHPVEKVMGVVVQVHSADVSHIEVKTSHGDVLVLTADSATKYVKGKANATLSDIKAGMRVVAIVTKDGQVTKVSEIQLGAMEATTHDEHAGVPHDHDASPQDH